MNLSFTAIVVVLLLAAVLGLFVGAALTGQVRRSYEVLGEEDEVRIAGSRMPLPKIAATYQPKMYLRQTTPSPPLLWIWYEAVLTPATLDLVYYFVWENETHPNPFLNRLYALFRAAYYGYPLYDIEYFQVSVELETGEVKGLRFETSPQDDYFVAVSEHAVERYFLRPDGLYDEVQMKGEEQVIGEQEGIDLNFDKQQIVAGVQTWNHLSRLVDKTESDFEVLMEAPLRYLGEEDYARFKFARKSQGDHQTVERWWSLPLASLFVSALIALPARMVSKLWRRKAPLVE